MKRGVLFATLIATVALVPVAVWMDDILVMSLAGLIPFLIDLKNGNLGEG